MPMTSTPAVSIGQVLALGGEQHRGAHAVVVEDLLDRDDPAEQIADLTAMTATVGTSALRSTWRRIVCAVVRPFIVAVRV